MDSKVFLVPIPDYIVEESGVDLSDVTEVIPEDGMLIIKNPMFHEDFDECDCCDIYCDRNYNSGCRNRRCAKRRN